ncbi:MAG: hypothetical protein CM15mP130_1320 [Verrucomicrobiota bacterium]|nr:MAG: hypothetical protein CM15mP130_1320 [Verrucomicrobiota bacterium]
MDATLGDAVKVAAAEDTTVEHIQKGGTWAYPIVIAAIISLLIALIKYLQLSGISFPRSQGVTEIIRKMEDGDKDGALKLAKNLKGPSKTCLLPASQSVPRGRKW